MVILVALAFVALIGTAFLILEYPLRRQGYRPSRTASAAPPPRAFVASRSQRFRGGARVGWFNASYPFASITLDDRRAWITGMASIWIDRDVVIRVRRIRGALGSGVRFDTEDGRYDGVIFWTFSSPTVLDAFTRFGWPVER